jgi:flagellin
MPSVSNIAVGALVAGAAASKARHGMNESIARLSTGLRSIYGGDAAGQSVANTLQARSKSWAVAARNAEDGISAAQTAESALLEIAALAQRLRELGIQADNAALLSSTNDIAAMDQEAVAIADAIDAIVTKSTFNGVALLGTAAKTHAIGVTDDGGTVTLKTSNGITAITAITQAGASDGSADTTLKEVAIDLGHVAAGIAALKGRQAVAYSASANLAAAASRIEDTDFAKETANLAKMSVLNQSAMAMVAQANQAQSAILAVLQ